MQLPDAQFGHTMCMGRDAHGRQPSPLATHLGLQCRLRLVELRCLPRQLLRFGINGVDFRLLGGSLSLESSQLPQLQTARR